MTRSALLLSLRLYRGRGATLLELALWAQRAFAVRAAQARARRATRRPGPLWPRTSEAVEVARALAELRRCEEYLEGALRARSPMRPGGAR